MPPKTIGPRRSVAIELILFLAYACFSASWMVGSIVTPDMVHEFGLDAIPSSVNNAISAAKILGNFVAAWILVKLGPKWTVSLSCLLTCAVVMGALASSFPVFILARFLLGFGGLAVQFQVRALAAQPGVQGGTALAAIGYKEFLPLLRGEGSLPDAVAAVKQASRRYAKRQRTWFYRHADTHWFYRDLQDDNSILSQMISLFHNTF